MSEEKRPVFGTSGDVAAVQAFVQGLQDAIDAGDADTFNRQFADDVLWGSPFGAVASGYDVIHPIHERMFAAVSAQKGAAVFQLEHVRFPVENVAVAYVRRVAVPSAGTPGSSARPGSFDELALFVLAKRDGRWWLVAAQHVPERRDVYAPGGALNPDKTA
jgi:uncharacterized protein (TIGR02246 family)